MTKISELKSEYIEYYKDMPVQKYAAMFIRRDEDTIIRWKSKDRKFADDVERAKAEWIRKKDVVYGSTNMRNKVQPCEVLIFV